MSPFDDSDHELRDEEYPDPDDSDDEVEDTLVCPRCHAEVYADVSYCPRCGADVTPDSHPFSGRSLWWIVFGLVGIAAVVLVFVGLRF